MTIQQIKDKIENLDYWLTKNPNDPYHAEVQKDKRAYEHRLLLLEPPIAKTLTP
ncbi:hypothetical protein [Flavobacterium rivuli]|uniref:hypothetical protein n=1 Tax=Flavobacterium rivuli TaxID=498301 RepID=UPI00035D87CD|nr:hypothetical protein [Flavobacterium rivuli]